MTARTSSKRLQRILPVAELVQKVAGPAFRRRGFAGSEIVARWPDIAGNILARYTLPEQIAFPVGETSGGTLHIRSEGAFALELQHLEPVLIDRINSFFGYPAVARLKILQGPLPDRGRRRKPVKAALAETECRRLRHGLSSIGDDQLRDALQSLGEAVLAEPPPGHR